MNEGFRSAVRIPLALFDAAEALPIKRLQAPPGARRLGVLGQYMTVARSF